MTRAMTPLRGAGIEHGRHFTEAGADPFDRIEWENRSANIVARDGSAVFEQSDVEFPKSWSQHATNIVVQNYFRGPVGDREQSIRQVIGRVVDTIDGWAEKDGYFRTAEDRIAFRDELKHILLHQKAAFNSPVWFNVGIEDHPQCSACFINRVEDTMESILQLAQTEGILFKHGSGTGSNLSALRSSRETLAGGGTASGPVSFMKGYDAFAGVIKSGGKCLAPHQRVYTSKGPMRVDELAAVGTFTCLSYDPATGRFMEKRARAWASGAKEVVRIVTDKGAFDLSTDHPVRLTSGEYRKAGTMAAGASLQTCTVDQDGSFEESRTHVAGSNHRVVGSELQGRMKVYDVEVDCPTADDHSPESGHNFVIWSTDRRTGSGIVVSNTRRAAKMVILDADHPDIVDFIECKVNEEKKAWALIDAGYDGSFTGTAYNSVFFQNSNNSVRVPDEFMRAVADDEKWQTRKVTGNREVAETHRARELMRAIATAAHVCGDPGMQFDTTINDWHTCPKTDRIYASNPCSEYMFLDDSACNLASLNLTRFLDAESGAFDVDAFRAAVRTMTTAQEIIVGNASYPTPAIERNSHDYRPLGLGYANLGALLMSWGLAYDSDRGRAAAAAITALMTGEGYAQSARIARDCGGPFAGFKQNRHEFLRVMGKHRAEAQRIRKGRESDNAVHDAAVAAWDEAVELGEEHGYRNAQATVLAPTGTIAFLMDCDTTGVEPDIALVKRKQLAGGGEIRIINQTVPAALRKLGYNEIDAASILEHIEEHGTIEGADRLDDKHLPVFDCAFKAKEGSRSIHYMGHIRMVAATQPFISGAISKTINLPHEATVDDMEQAYIEGWRLGLKAIAVYRNGSKRTQPLTTEERPPETETVADAGRPIRRKLPDERAAITHKFDISGHEGYITVGMYDDGKPGEVFLVMAKEGSTISGFGDSFAQAISYSLQYGVPLEVLIDKFTHQRFEPAGVTRNPEVRFAKSIVDYMFRWLSTKFLSTSAQQKAGVNVPADAKTDDEPKDGPDAGEAEAKAEAAGTEHEEARTAEGPPGYEIENDTDAPPCSNCGAIMIRSGTCYKCINCGATSGCG